MTVEAIASVNTLSPRQREVLKLAALGNTKKEIAGQLHLSEPTIQHHLMWARVKLRARDTKHAVYLACQAGIL